MEGKVKGTMGALTLEMVKIVEVKMLPSNAKIHSQKHIDKIVKSIKEFGFKQLTLITTDSFIIAGHCRYTVGKSSVSQSIKNTCNETKRNNKIK